MSNFVEKIGEKLHIGGNKKEGELEQHPPPHAAGYGAGEHQHPPQQVGYAQPQAGGYGGQHGTQPEHGYGGGYGGEHAPHSVEQVGYAKPQGYEGHRPEQLGSHPEHGYGGEHGQATGYAGGVHGKHGTAGLHDQQGLATGYAGGVHGEHGTTGLHDQHHGVGAPPPAQHKGPFEKVKHKIKHDGEKGDSSSSSSSESDGEGGRRKKKLGIF